MSTSGYTPMQPDSTSLNGRYLEHYLNTMEKMQDTFLISGKEGRVAFNKFVYYLRSTITDDKKVEDIDTAMAAEAKRLKDNPDFDDEQKTFMVGFVVVHHAMKHLDHTLQISKRQVTVLADQSDKCMPEPPQTAVENGVVSEEPEGAITLG